MTLLANEFDINALKNQPARIGVTELAKDTNGWRAKLAENGLLEITDRNSTAAYLISADELENILTRFDEQEAAIEELSVAAMFDARAASARWISGDDLAKDAKAALAARFAE